MKTNGVLTEKKVYNYVLKHVGSTAEQIKVGLKVEATEEVERLGRLLRGLRDSKHVRGRGNTRSMIYLATSKQYA